MENQRNILLAVVLTALLLLGWNVAMDKFYPQPAQNETGAAETLGQGANAPSTAADSATTGVPGEPQDQTAKPVDLSAALASATRVRIAAPRITGSINLVGARVDDIELKDHRQTVEKDSGPVRLFAPQGTTAQQFAQFGWIGSNPALPDAQTVWQADGEILSADHPVTLTHKTAEGLTFSIRLSIDDQYMLTARQSVTNASGTPVALQPFALINRTSTNASPDSYNVHSGPIGAFGDSVSYDPDYDDLAEAGRIVPEGQTDWIGFTDIYWLSALVPQAGSKPDSAFRALGDKIFRADMIYQTRTVPAGGSADITTRLFVGAKESGVLDRYEDGGIENFGKAIDWGWFGIIERPILWLLKQLYHLAGNFGVAIILLTVIVRGLMFPIAQKGFASMAAMKAIQPQMKAIQERHKDDKLKAQQEIQKLFKEEGANPLSGCLPMLLQIPIFFALYKVLLLAIEMRHKPFVLWIEDLSAPDPAHILNLFGLLPFDPPGFLAIGVLALLLGITMWFTFRLNPSAMDPVQQKMFSFMPWVMMFVMAPFAAGLLLYWVTSNILTLAQQSYLYSKHPQMRAAIEKEKAAKAKAVEVKG